MTWSCNCDSTNPLMGPWHAVGCCALYAPAARYASPSLRMASSCVDFGWVGWKVTAHPYGEFVGFVQQHGTAWTAHTFANHYAGLWPTKQAAAEVLVKQAGYELETT